MEMAGPEGGRTEALVRSRIFLVTDAEEFGVEKAYHGREHGFSIEFALFEVLFDLGAKLRQRFPESQAIGIFGLVAAGPEIRMIAILLAAAGIAAGCLKVAVRILAIPGIAIGRWKADGAEPVYFVPIGDPLPAFVEVCPVAAIAPAGVAWLVIAAVAQSLGLFVHWFAA